jgi:hypothetical protein
VSADSVLGFWAPYKAKSSSLSLLFLLSFLRSPLCGTNPTPFSSSCNSFFLQSTTKNKAQSAFKVQNVKRKGSSQQPAALSSQQLALFVSRVTCRAAAWRIFPAAASFSPLESY